MAIYNTHDQALSHPNRNKRPFDLAVYFITFALGVTTLAAASSALVKRNHDVGFATKAAAAVGVKLIVATNSLTEPGFALSTAATGVFINALTLFLISFKMPHFQRKAMWLSPILSTFYFIFMLATCIAVFYEAKTGHLTSYGTLNGVVLPQSVLNANAAALGLSADFWGKGYVKFMAIISVPTTVFAGITAFLSYGFYKRESAALRAEQNAGLSQSGTAYQQGGGLTNVMSTEKAGVQHVESV